MAWQGAKCGHSHRLAQPRALRRALRCAACNTFRVLYVHLPSSLTRTLTQGPHGTLPSPPWSFFALTVEASQWRGEARRL